MNYGNQVQGHVEQTFQVGGKIGDNYKMWLVSFASAHNDLEAQLHKDFRQQSPDFLLSS